MSTHDTYVNFETAKLLREAGFDWGCEHCYFNDKFDEDLYEPDNFLDCTYQIAAPTLDVAQRWLREVREIEVNTLCVYINNVKKYSYSVFEGKYNNERIEEGFNTYEEAQEAGIQKCLEILLK